MSISMNAAERQRRKRRLELAGFKALPTGWVPAEYADKVAEMVEAYSKEVQEASTVVLPMGRPRLQK